MKISILLDIMLVIMWCRLDIFYTIFQVLRGKSEAKNEHGRQVMILFTSASCSLFTSPTYSLFSLKLLFFLNLFISEKIRRSGALVAFLTLPAFSTILHYFNTKKGIMSIILPKYLVKRQHTINKETFFC